MRDCRKYIRMKWLEAMHKGADVKGSKASQGYEFCKQLFEFE